MKECWHKEPEKRLEFTAISMRLKNPYHDYDVPPAEEGPEEDKELLEPGIVYSQGCLLQCLTLTDLRGLSDRLTVNSKPVVSTVEDNKRVQQS